MYIYIQHLHVFIQPIPEKTILEMLAEMQIEILDGSETFINYTFECKQHLHIRMQTTSQFECVPRDTEALKFEKNLISNLYDEIPGKWSFSILTT